MRKKISGYTRPDLKIPQIGFLVPSRLQAAMQRHKELGIGSVSELVSMAIVLLGELDRDQLSTLFRGWIDPPFLTKTDSRHVRAYVDARIIQILDAVPNRFHSGSFLLRAALAHLLNQDVEEIARLQDKTSRLIQAQSMPLSEVPHAHA